MAQQTINIGSAPNDATGDTLRTSFSKCNSNFTELYGSYASLVSPVFSGDPRAPTPTAGDNDTSIATTAFVTSATGAIARTSPQGRLTLQTSVAVMVTTTSGATTIRYTPYVGDKVPIYDGTNMVMTTFTELSVLTTDTTKSPAAIGASKVNDWFVWNDSGTIRLGHGPDWTSDTARSAGTALTRVNGIWLNNAAITNGPTASRGTYVGTTRSNGSSTLDWIFGIKGASAGGTATFNIWNMYNRADVISTVRVDGVWTLAAEAIRPAGNYTSMRVNFVCGLEEEPFFGMYGTDCRSGNDGIGWALNGIGYDSTTAFSGTPGGTTCFINLTNALGLFDTTCLGYHFFQAMESAHTSGTALFMGDNSDALYHQGGLRFSGRM